MQSRTEAEAAAFLLRVRAGTRSLVDSGVLRVAATHTERRRGTAAEVAAAVMAVTADTDNSPTLLDDDLRALLAVVIPDADDLVRFEAECVAAADGITAGLAHLDADRRRGQDRHQAQEQSPPPRAVAPPLLEQLRAGPSSQP